MKRVIENGEITYVIETRVLTEEVLARAKDLARTMIGIAIVAIRLPS